MTDNATNTFLEDEDEDFFESLIPINNHQIACSGIELSDLINYSESVDDSEDAFFERLGLSYTFESEEDRELKLRTFNEIDVEKYYILIFPEGTDLADFDIVDLVAFEEITQETYNSLSSAYNTDPCDGDCENCPQDCIGKQPID